MTNTLLVSENSTATATYSYHDQTIRTILQDGEALFCLADVCRALELTNVAHLTAQIKEEFAIPTLNVGVIERKTGPIKAAFITEPQLYFVMMRSRAERAREFRQWICNEVLPSIRKTGKYDVKEREQSKPEQQIPVTGLSYLKQIEMLVEKYRFAPNDVLVLENIKSKARAQGYGMAMARSEKELNVKVIGLQQEVAGLQQEVNRLNLQRQKDAENLKNISDDFYTFALDHKQ